MKKFIVFILMLFPSFAFPATYWVDDNGSASWFGCQSSSPMSGASACSLSTANTNASTGDTVYIRAGSYTTTIQPSNSGSSGNPITYARYGSETVNINAS